MASTKKTVVHRDFSKQELKNYAHELLAADPAGFNLYEGRKWINTTTGKEITYRNGVKCVVACEQWVLDEISKMEHAQAGFDASGGGLPLLVDKVRGDLTTMQAGDFWFINNAGTITGIQGDDVLSVGDKIQFMGGDATLAINWIGIQTNLNDTLLGYLKVDRQVVNLVANTDLTVSSSAVIDIHSIQVYDTSGSMIEVCISKNANLNERVLHSNVSLTGVEVELIGKSN